jgi:hypothetical protein
MRISVLLGLLLVVGSVAHEAGAQVGTIHCPPAGTRLTFSDGGRIEAVSDQGNYVCRFRSLKTFKPFDRLFGVFLPTGPNANQIRSLAPLEVGHKISFSNSGPDVLGGDGFWFHDIVIERFEKVTSAAGTFDAFVILYDDRALQSSHGRWQRRYWYSPDVADVVKFQFLTLSGSPPPKYPKDWELTAYEPAWNPAVAVHAPPTPVVAAPPPTPASKPQPPSKPVQAAAAPVPVVEPIKLPAPALAAPVVMPKSLDGVWEMDMQVTTTYGTTVGGECQPHSSIPLTFVDGSVDGSSVKLQLTRDRGISGWMRAPSMGTSMLPFIVNVSGRLEDGAFAGSVSGRCTGSFTMRKQ